MQISRIVKTHTNTHARTHARTHAHTNTHTPPQAHFICRNSKQAHHIINLKFRVHKKRKKERKKEEEEGAGLIKADFSSAPGTLFAINKV